jgi:hypothetical protein
MTLPEAMEVLKNHQIWRKGADITPTDPKQLTEALDIVIQLVESLN